MKRQAGLSDEVIFLFCQTPGELTAYYDWKIGFEADRVENLVDSFSKADIDLLVSVEQQMQQETMLMPRTVDSFYQIYSQFENVADMTSVASMSDEAIDLLISIEEKMRQSDSILTPCELDAYRHWHHQIGLLNPFEFNDDEQH